MKFSTRDITFVALFVALLTIGSKITIPSPIVPFTMQFMFVVLAGMLLGSRLGLTSMIVYIMLGLIGIPVFAKGGGIGYLVSPTFGYIIGFAVAAYIIGKMVEQTKGKLTFLKAFGITLVGLIAVYILGVSYMLLIKNLYIGSAMTLGKAFWYGVVLFIPTDLIFCIISALIGTKVASRVRAIIN